MAGSVCVCVPCVPPPSSSLDNVDSCGEGPGGVTVSRETTTFRFANGVLRLALHADVRTVKMPRCGVPPFPA